MTWILLKNYKTRLNYIKRLQDFRKLINDRELGRKRLFVIYCNTIYESYKKDIIKIQRFMKYKLQSKVNKLNINILKQEHNVIEQKINILKRQHNDINQNLNHLESNIQQEISNIIVDFTHTNLNIKEEGLKN